MDLDPELHADMSTRDIVGPWVWTPVTPIEGKRPGRLIILWGYVNVLETIYSDRLDLHTFTQNFEGIYLARTTRVLIIYT
jgi:hypothetical protein